MRLSLKKSLFITSIFLFCILLINNQKSLKDIEFSFYDFKHNLLKPSKSDFSVAVILFDNEENLNKDFVVKSLEKAKVIAIDKTNIESFNLSSVLSKKKT